MLAPMLANMNGTRSTPPEVPELALTMIRIDNAMQTIPATTAHCRQIRASRFTITIPGSQAILASLMDAQAVPRRQCHPAGMTLTGTLFIVGIFTNLIASGILSWVQYRSMRHPERPRPTRLLIALATLAAAGFVSLICSLIIRP